VQDENERDGSGDSAPPRAWTCDPDSDLPITVRKASAKAVELSVHTKTEAALKLYARFNFEVIDIGRHATPAIASTGIM
jgi:hypothetical protein